VPPGAARRAADLLWNTGRRLSSSCLTARHQVVAIARAVAAPAPHLRWLLARGTGEHRRQGPPGLVHPWPQEPPVPHGQCLVLGVHGCDQLLEQAADLSGPVPSAVVGCARPAWRSHRPMRSITPVRRGGHDRARCLAVSAVRTGGSRVLVVVGVSRSSAAASASQAGFLRDLQISTAAISAATSTTSRIQPRASGLAGGRLGSSRRRGSGGCRQRRRRCRRLDRCRRPGRCWRLSGGPGRSRRRRGRLAR
jgi:hypothetical protein